MALSVMLGGVPQTVRVALLALHSAGFGRQLGADWQDSLCHLSGGWAKALATGMGAGPRFAAAELQRAPPALVDIETQTR
ncbi:hypothetical protein Shyd_86140 [Streptomyces hydrogenans]|uniref:Uncharacterized protein n=1 Tax=Streptomyces hydrogenans TaxID=1873719 RepID=A0ABQ3PQE8_9ACTN|nr:hypothetical protein GCM10018784_74200 [Streptomyces hydrogenans]GHI27243.1 hypothetical protein Shyd_86140 [Streptomyces hydrogenans]